MTPSRPAPNKAPHAAGRGSSHKRAKREPAGRRRDREVLDVAAEVFFEQGYASATVQAVADRLGMLKGSLYYYIDTKEDLLFRLVEEVHDQVDEILERVMSPEGVAPLERLREYVRLQLMYNVENLTRISIYYHDVDQLGADRRAAISKRRKEHERQITALIVDAQQAGQANPTLNARVLSNCLFATVIWVYRWYRPQGSVKRDELADVCSRFVLSGIIGSEPAAAVPSPQA